jgi:hypothetical protein
MDQLTQKIYRYRSTTLGWSADSLIYPSNKGPQGDAGRDGVCPPCPPSGGGSGFITPYLQNDFIRINVAAYGIKQTVAGAGVNPAVYAGITVLGTDNFDWANLQYAIYLSYTTKKPIFLINGFQGLKDLIVKWDHYWLAMDGANPVSTTLQFEPNTTGLNREDATTATWQAMISNTRWVIQNMSFNLGTNAIGIDSQSQNGSEFNNLVFNQGATGMICKFTINTQFNNIKVFTPTNGGILIDNASQLGLPAVQTGSVKNTFRNFHLISFGTCNFGIKLHYCESTVIDGIIIEGYLVKKGIDNDAGNDPNFRELFIYNLYCESGMVNGPYTGIGNGQAIVYSRTNAGNITIIGVKGVYPAVLLDIGSGGGMVKAVIQEVTWWPHISTPTGNKAIWVESTGASVAFEFSGWANGAFINNFPDMFAGRPISYGCVTNGNAQPTWSVCVR